MSERKSFPWFWVALYWRMLVWQLSPHWHVAWITFAACAIFWGLALWQQSRSSWSQFWPVSLLRLVGIGGALMNAVATLANGGLMPVRAGFSLDSVWVPMTEAHRVKWLCDIYPLGKFASLSLGDFLIFGSVAAYLLLFGAVWVGAKIERHNEAKAEAK